MTDQIRSSAYQRILMVVTAMTLVGALGGGLGLVLRAEETSAVPGVSYTVASGPGVVTLARVGDPGELPFTQPVAADLSVDAVKLVLQPLNAQSAESPHRPGSAADRIVAQKLIHQLTRARDSAGVITVRRVAELAEAAFGIDAIVGDLLDVDGDDVDDDRRFTVTSLDGSAVCVTLGNPRHLALAQRLVIDPVDGVPASGVSWSPYGACGDPAHTRSGIDVRVGTTPGTYGGVRSGDVCDADGLVVALTSNAVVAASWAAVQAIKPTEIGEYVATLTPVVLLRDTLVTDHGFDNGRVRTRQSVLERGTAVLVDRGGLPRVRCVSGSPLRRPQPITGSVRVEGEPWRGFSVHNVAEIPAAESPVSRFILVDLASGLPLRRDAGAAGSLSVLAGRVLPATSPVPPGG